MAFRCGFSFLHFSFGPAYFLQYFLRIIKNDGLCVWRSTALSAGAGPGCPAKSPAARESRRAEGAAGFPIPAGSLS